MRDALTGTLALVRLALRLDRVRLLLWIGGLVVGTLAIAASLAELYATDEARESIAAAMNSPAGLAMTGPSAYLADYHAGAMLVHQVLGFVLVLVGIMSVLIVVRHTRSEEESGVAELIRSNVVGRHAHLSAAVIVAVLANLVLAVFMFVGVATLELDGATLSGAVLYGAAHFAVGLVFTATAAVTAQVTEHPRAASGIAMAVIGVAFVLRALGDMGDGTLAWLSPIGWSQATLVFLEDRWWPLAIAIFVSLTLVGLAFALSTRRDVAAGLRRPRSGRAQGSSWLLTPAGFTLRLHRGLAVGWLVAMVLIGLSYGSVLGDAGGMLTGVDVLEDAVAAIGGASIAESFASLVTMVMAVIASVYVIMAALRPRSEESKGRAEALITAGVSRVVWLATHLLVVVVVGSVVMGAAGLSLGLAGAATTGDGGLVTELLGAALAYTPALWVAAGFTAALIGLLPRFALLAWVIPVYGFVVGYLGQILEFPRWLLNLSPFWQIPRLPAQEMEWMPLAILTFLSGILVIAGVLGVRRRDLLSTT